MPSPVSDDHDLDLRADAPDVRLDAAAPRRELDGVRQQVPHRLLQPLAIAVDTRGAVLDDGLDAQALHLRGRLESSSTAADDHAAEVDELDVEAELAGDDPRQVEQVLDEPGLRRGVADDGVDGVRRPRWIDDAGLEHLAPAHDRVDRRAQLVRERRQELVLRPVRGPGFAVGAGVVDGERGPLRDGLRDQHVLAVVGPLRFRRHEGHHPERAAVGDERHRDVRVQLQRAQRLEVRRAARALLEHRVGDPCDHGRLPGAEDVRWGAWRVGLLGEALAQGARELDLRRDRCARCPAA